MKQRILVDFAPERLEDQHSPSTYVMSCPRGEVESQEWAIKNYCLFFLLQGFHQLWKLGINLLLYCHCVLKFVTIKPSSRARLEPPLQPWPTLIPSSVRHTSQAPNAFSFMARNSSMTSMTWRCQRNKREVLQTQTDGRTWQNWQNHVSDPLIVRMYVTCIATCAAKMLGFGAWYPSEGYGPSTVKPENSDRKLRFCLKKTMAMNTGW